MPGQGHTGLQRLSDGTKKMGGKGRNIGTHTGIVVQIPRLSKNDPFINWHNYCAIRIEVICPSARSFIDILP